MHLYCLFALAITLLTAGCATTRKGSEGSNPKTTPVYALSADQFWQLNLPDGLPFDASGLLQSQDGRLFAVNDKQIGIHQIRLWDGSSAADLEAIPDYFTMNQLEKFKSEKIGRYDFEGIAQDTKGRLYICEEGNRWVLRLNPSDASVERLEIDWAPVQKYLHSSDHNASFEGIAIGNGRLYLANERKQGRIIVVDLSSRQIVDHFRVQPIGKFGRHFHYSDLSWFQGFLYVLLRDKRCVLKVDPRSHLTVAQYDFEQLEEASETKYHKLYPTGNMEGLAVDEQFIWLVTDNNGLSRVQYPKDIRPTLFRCPRPDAPSASQ